MVGLQIVNSPDAVAGFLDGKDFHIALNLN